MKEGRDIIEREVEKLGMTLKSFEEDPIVKKHMEKHVIATMDDLYFQLAEKRSKVEVIIGKLKTFYEKERVEKEKEELGVVLAEAGFSGYLKGKDVEAVLAKLYPKFEAEKFHQMCEEYQIPLDKFIKEYSTGMKAKLNLIIALTHQAEFLMLDEPTAGLDVGAREEMLDILRTYMEEEPERSILVSSHISSDLEHLCDDIYVIHKGKIVLHEEMDTILEKYAVLKVSEEQYQAVDKRYLLKEKKEVFGIACLTNEKQYYIENYPEIVVESGSLDQVILMLTGGGM